MKLISTVVLAATLAVTGCASAGGGGGGGSNPNILTREQIETVRGTSSAYDVVSRLRSRWLRSTSSNTQLSAGSAQDFQVQVYLDQVRMGGIEELRGISKMDIQYIRWFPPAEASGRYGFDHGAGAILVSTRPLEP